jgi:DNA polymerase I-like protein with 3'-5' exonuclease and polymerase domains/uracil-DNA glycosylase
MDNKDIGYGFFTELEGVLLAQKKPARVKGGNKEKKETTKKKSKLTLLESLVLNPPANPCDGCEWENHPKFQVGECVPLKPGLLIITQQPSVAAWNSGSYTKAESFQVYRDILHECGFAPEEYTFTSVVRSMGPGKPGTEVIQCCSHYLRKEILHPNVKAILFLGIDPLNTLTESDRSSVFHARGRRFSVLDKPAMVTFDPATLSWRPENKQMVKEAIVRCHRLATGLYGSDYKPRYLKPRTGEDIIEALESLLEYQRANPDNELALDIESMYCKEYGSKALDVFHPEFRIWSIGISWGDYCSVAFPFDPDPYLIEKFGLSSIHSHPRILELVQELAKFPNIHHSNFDALGLGIPRYGVRYPDLHDSMPLQYAIDDTAGSLKVEELAEIYTEDGDYKRKFESPDSKEQLDWDIFMEYNCHDTDIERRIFFTLKEEAISANVWDAYNNVIRVENMVGIEMTLVGVEADRDNLDMLIKQEEALKTPFVEEYFQHPDVLRTFNYIIQQVAEGSKNKKFRSIQSIRDLDISKTWVLEVLFFDVVGLTPPKTTEKGARSVDEEVFETLVKQYSDHSIKPLLDTILKIRKIDKKLSTYLLPYIEPKIDKKDITPEEKIQLAAVGKVTRYQYIKVDGLIHPKFKFFGVRGGRSASFDPNFQNIVNDLAIKRTFRSRKWDGKQGYIGMVDYATHEVRKAAFLCQDPNMIKALEIGFHTLNLASLEKLVDPKDIPKMTPQDTARFEDIIYKRYLQQLTQEKPFPDALYEYPYQDIMQTLSAEEEYKELVAIWKNQFKKRRTVAKESTFGPLYGMTPPTFASIQGITREEAEEVYRIDRETYPVKHAYFDEIKARAARDGFVQNIFGKKRRLDYKRAGSNDKAIAELDRQAVNSMVQGPASDLGLLAMAECQRIFKQEKLPAVGFGTIHDSLATDSAEEYTPLVLGLVCHIMETHPITLLGENEVKFMAEPEYGRTWGDLKDASGIIEKIG